MNAKNRIVVMLIDRAEFRAEHCCDIKRANWENDLDKFLADTELPVLSSTGPVSREEALDWAGTQRDCPPPRVVQRWADTADDTETGAM
jgi:hypothetical protein